MSQSFEHYLYLPHRLINVSATDRYRRKRYLYDVIRFFSHIIKIKINETLIFYFLLLSTRVANISSVTVGIIFFSQIHSTYEINPCTDNLLISPRNVPVCL